jgi:fructose-specific phosphotransferase system IIC component
VSVGALASMQLTGMLCARLGAGAVSAIAAVLTSIAITLPGAAGSIPELAAIVLAFGAATAVSGSLVMALGAAVDAPHGGVLVLPLVAHPFGFVAALAAGVAVAAALVMVGKSRIRRAAGSAGLRLGQPDEAESW